MVYLVFQKSLTKNKQTSKQKTVKYLFFLVLLQEKRELLSPGLPATSITKKLLGGKKSNSKIFIFFLLGIQCKTENCTVAIFLCLLAFQSIWNAVSLIL